MLTVVGHAGASLPGDLAANLVQLCFDLQAQGHLILPLLAPLRSLAAQWPGLLTPLAGCLGLLLQSSGMSCLLLPLACQRRSSGTTPCDAGPQEQEAVLCLLCMAAKETDGLAWPVSGEPSALRQLALTCLVT